MNAEYNTAGCPYTGNPSDRNPYACPTALPPGPYIIDLPSGDYEITLTAGVPGNDYIWDGDASSGISFAAPNVLGASEDFIHSAGPIALYWYDWYPYDNDPSINSTFTISTVPQAPRTRDLGACRYGTGGVRVRWMSSTGGANLTQFNNGPAFGREATAGTV